MSGSRLGLESLENRQLLAVSLATGNDPFDGARGENVFGIGGPEPSMTVQATETGDVFNMVWVDGDDSAVKLVYEGPGSVTVALGDSEAPGEGSNSGAPLVWKGNASISISGFTQDSTIRLVAFDQVPGTTGNGLADAKSVSLLPDPNQPAAGATFGNLFLANAWFAGDSGNVGINAGGTNVSGLIRIGDINSSGSAVPNLAVGNSTTGEVEVFGGDLISDNGTRIQDTPTQFGLEAPVDSGLIPGIEGRGVTFPDGTTVEAQTFSPDQFASNGTGTGGDIEFILNDETTDNQIDDFFNQDPNFPFDPKVYDGNVTVIVEESFVSGGGFIGSTNIGDGTAIFNGDLIWQLEGDQNLDGVDVAVDEVQGDLLIDGSVTDFDLFVDELGGDFGVTGDTEDASFALNPNGFGQEFAILGEASGELDLDIGVVPGNQGVAPGLISIGSLSEDGVESSIGEIISIAGGANPEDSLFGGFELVEGGFNNDDTLLGLTNVGRSTDDDVPAGITFEGDFDGDAQGDILLLNNSAIGDLTFTGKAENFSEAFTFFNDVLIGDVTFEGDVDNGGDTTFGNTATDVQVGNITFAGKVEDLGALVDDANGDIEIGNVDFQGDFLDSPTTLFDNLNIVGQELTVGNLTFGGKFDGTGLIVNNSANAAVEFGNMDFTGAEFEPNVLPLGQIDILGNVMFGSEQVELQGFDGESIGDISLMHEGRGGKLTITGFEATESIGNISAENGNIILNDIDINENDDDVVSTLGLISTVDGNIELQGDIEGDNDSIFEGFSISGTGNLATGGNEIDFLGEFTNVDDENVISSIGGISVVGNSASPSLDGDGGVVEIAAGSIGDITVSNSQDDGVALNDFVVQTQSGIGNISLTTTHSGSVIANGGVATTDSNGTQFYTGGSIEDIMIASGNVIVDGAGLFFAAGDYNGAAAGNGESGGADDVEIGNVSVGNVSIEGKFSAAGSLGTDADGSGLAILSGVSTVDGANVNGGAIDLTDNNPTGEGSIGSIVLDDNSDVWELEGRFTPPPLAVANFFPVIGFDTSEDVTVVYSTPTDPNQTLDIDEDNEGVIIGDGSGDVDAGELVVFRL